MVALIAVLVILLIVYRSPIVPFFVLFTSVFALALASVVVYYLAKNDVIKLNGQSQGILSILVIGAATDYALLLVSRYREELRRHDDRYEAMSAGLAAHHRARRGVGRHGHPRPALPAAERPVLDQGPRAGRRRSASPPRCSRP